MNIFDYTDYRKFLHDYYTEQKSKHSYFTVRYIAEKVGFKSASFYCQLINRRSNISLELAQKFCEFFKFTPNQSEYFIALICYNQAKSHDEKKLYFEKLTSFRSSRIKNIDSKFFEYYDKWYYSAIRELLFFYKFKDNYKELSKQLEPPISPQQAESAIKRLHKWGFIQKDENSFFVRSDNRSTTTGPDAESFYINNYQTAVLQLARAALDYFPREQRQFSTLTMSLSEKGYERFLDELQQMRSRLLSIAEQDSEENRVYQLNLQLFPLTKQIDRDSV